MPATLSEHLNKRIAILGAGREGLAAAKYLRTLFPGIELILISESPPQDEVLDQLDALDRLVVCPLSEARLETYELLIRSPGISPYRESLQQARLAGVEFTSPSNLWFAAHPDAKTICITGTKGKSTTSALVAHVLRACGLKVQLAGNIGLPLLSCEDQGVDWWVIELSSYQLADLEAAPTLGVILNFSAEHLDWHGSETVYRQDKFRLAYLCRQSSLILNAGDPAVAELVAEPNNIHQFNSRAGIHVSGSQLMNRDSLLPVKLSTSLPGQHNLSNAAAALTVVEVINADMDRAVESLSAFHGLPHRLQLVGKRHGVRYFNDSISSTPMATEAALSAFSGQPVILIVGGLDRGLDWAPYMETFRSELPGAIIAIPDNGEQILDTMRAAGIEPEKGLHLASGLDQAVALANELVESGGLVLLSPGAPSFPRFRDYRDRGRQFSLSCGFVLDEWKIF